METQIKISKDSDPRILYEYNRESEKDALKYLMKRLFREGGYLTIKGDKPGIKVYSSIPKNFHSEPEVVTTITATKGSKIEDIVLSNEDPSEYRDIPDLLERRSAILTFFGKRGNETLFVLHDGPHKNMYMFLDNCQ